MCPLHIIFLMFLYHFWLMKLPASHLFFPIPANQSSFLSLYKKALSFFLLMYRTTRFFSHAGSLLTVPFMIHCRIPMNEENTQNCFRTTSDLYNFRTGPIPDSKVLSLPELHYSCVWSWCWLSDSIPTELTLSVHPHHLPKVKDQVRIESLTLLP